MAIREIPKSFEYVCDCCGVVDLQKNASGHYSNSRPPRWASLTLAQDAYDYQGNAVADGTVKLLLCDRCRDAMADAINAVAKERATA